MPRSIDPTEPTRRKQQETVGVLDVIAELAEKFRGRIHGVFGSLLGAVLDMTTAWRDANRQATAAMPTGPAPAAPAAPRRPSAAAPVVVPTTGPIPTATPRTATTPPANYAGYAPGAHMPGQRPPTIVQARAAPPGAVPVGVAPAAEAGLGMTAAALATPLAIVGAVTAGMMALKAVTLSAVDAVGSWAVEMASPEANPARVFEALGAHVTDSTEKLIYLGNALGILGPAVGNTAQAFGRMMRNLDALANRYEEYNPQLAQATAMAEVRQTLGDLRRAQQVGPDLGRYITAQSQMQQRYEDLKVKLLEQILPATTDMVKVTSELLKVAKTMAPLIELAMLVSPVIQGMRLLARFLPEQEEREEGLPDPLAVSLEERGVIVP